MAIRAVLFDCWGTLISYAVRDPGFIGARLLERCNNPEGQTAETIEAAWRAMMGLYYANESPFESNIDALINSLCIELGLEPRITLSQLVAETVGAQYLQEKIPGVERMLAFLREHNLPCAVGSNSVYDSRTTAGYIAQRLPIDQFRFIASSADLASKKPHPRFFHLLSKIIGVPASECCYIGDSFTHDMVGSYTAMYGLSIWLNPQGLPKPDPTIACESARDYDEAIEILRRKI